MEALISKETERNEEKQERDKERNEEKYFEELSKRNNDLYSKYTYFSQLVEYGKQFIFEATYQKWESGWVYPASDNDGKFFEIIRVDDTQQDIRIVYYKRKDPGVRCSLNKCLHNPFCSEKRKDLFCDKHEKEMKEDDRSIGILELAEDGLHGILHNLKNEILNNIEPPYVFYSKTKKETYLRTSWRVLDLNEE
jgi:hypothetical protein